MLRSTHIKLLVLATLAPIVLWAALPMTSQGSLGGKIAQKRADIARKRGKEHALSGDISGITQRIHGLEGSIDQLRSKQVRIEADLNQKRAILGKTQSELKKERDRLKRLQARLALSKRVLSARLVQLYKADKPDMVTVVLKAKGFTELLEQAEFMRRISKQDRSIILNVRNARVDAASATERLQGLEKTQAEVAQIIEKRRNEVAQVKQQLVSKSQAFAAQRAKKKEILGSVRDSRKDDEEDLGKMERVQASIQAKLRSTAGTVGRSAGPGSGKLGPIRQASGGLIWPVNGSVGSPFGYRCLHGLCRLHAGVDIPIPSGTPIRAAKAGTVVVMRAESGYGNYTCVQHEGALSTCYAHQSRFGTSVGAHVQQGQVIGYSGCTGRCFGAHVHFETRMNGIPINPMNFL